MQKKFLSLFLMIMLGVSCSKNMVQSGVKADATNDVKNDKSTKSSKKSTKNSGKKFQNSKKEISRKIVYFNTNSSEISNQDVAILSKESIESVAPNSKITIIAEGHCDERGSEKYNYKLGKKRASAVKNILVKNGFDAKKISIMNYGETKPVDTNHDENAWSKNRRVEVVIYE
jgi:peptidoglycan-associated lipoprotein